MVRRRRSSVTSEERIRWLDEFEKEGKITKISNAAGRDIRTVKRHIEIADTKRETKRVRRDFLLGRLELHQEDILGEVRRLLGTLAPSAEFQRLEPADAHEKMLHHAFVEHIRRLPVFNFMARWERAFEDYANFREKLKENLELEEKGLVDRLPRDSLFEWSPKVESVQDEMLRFQSANEFDYTKEKQSPEGTNIHIFWASTWPTEEYVEESMFDSILEAHKELRSSATEQVSELRPLHSELASLATKITDELEAFLMRRLVPARCQYCPL